ncbi:IS200/IS605 family transposase [Thermodesulfobacteriota bacterium]
MANTYTQLYVHIVFSVNSRTSLISRVWKEDLYKYISGIVTAKKQKLMIVNGVSHHIHLLVGFSPSCSISNLVRDIKSNSSKWINEKGFAMGKFGWQTGFGAFTIGQPQVSRVIKYIIDQETHHRKKTYREEYVNFLKAYQVEYNMEYAFDD